VLNSSLRNDPQAILLVAANQISVRTILDQSTLAFDLSVWRRQIEQYECVSIDLRGLQSERTEETKGSEKESLSDVKT